MGDIRGLTGQWLGLRRLATRLAWIAKRPIWATLTVLDELTGILVEKGRLVGALAMLGTIEGTLVEKGRLLGSLSMRDSWNGILE